MLFVQNITKKFGNNIALNSVSFKAKNGEIVALLGKNGAGKSTLLRIISGFIEADSGSVSFDDKDVVKNRNEFLEQLAYVPENSSLYPDMKVFEYLEFVANLRCNFAIQINRKISEVCSILNLQNVLLQKCETLSKGYKKRVQIAAALLSNSSILLFDEPTEGLDPSQKQSLHRILKKLSKNHHVIISTHLMEDVEAVADKIVLIDKGILLCDQSLNEFKRISRTNLIDSFNLATKG